MHRCFLFGFCLLSMQEICSGGTNYDSIFKAGKKLDFVRRCQFRFYHAGVDHHPHLFPLACRAKRFRSDRIGHLGTYHFDCGAHSGGTLSVFGSACGLPRNEKKDFLCLSYRGCRRSAAAFLCRQLDFLSDAVCFDPTMLQRLQHLL